MQLGVQSLKVRFALRIVYYGEELLRIFGNSLIIYLLFASSEIIAEQIQFLVISVQNIFSELVEQI